MPLIICLCCGRRRNVAKRKSGVLRCSRCGAAAARVIHRVRHWMALDDYDGLDRDQARHNAYAYLKWWAEQKGYKPGYASVKFKELFGEWPNGESREDGQPPTPELLRWIRMQANAWKREIKKREAAKTTAPSPEVISVLLSEKDIDVSWR